MGAKPVVATLTSGIINPSTLNSNFDILATAIADALDRTGSSDTNNQMLGDLDMGGFTIRNALGTITEPVEFPASIAALRSLTPDAGTIYYVRGFAVDGDGGGGYFTFVTGEAPGTYTDNGGTIILPDGGDGSEAWLRDTRVVTPRMFGAGGLGATDDTAALVAALTSNRPVDFERGVYLHSGIDISIGYMVWKSSGAQLVYSGPQIQNGFKATLGLSKVHTIEGEITFDGGGTAHVAGRFASAALVGTAYDALPSLTIKNIIGKNAYRASTAFADGDALSIDGGFQKVDIDGVIARDSYMAVGAEVFGVYGIFGLSLRSLNSRFAQHITINNYHIENIWSEDATYTSDQDGIRIFQDMDDEGATCKITNGVSRNVSGRSIKLHSAPNAIVDGLHIERRSTVVPQQGLYSTPDIDCQQAPAIVKNISFVYDGVWRGSVVQNWTDRGQFRYGHSGTDNIKGIMINTAGQAMNVVSLTTSLDPAPADTSSDLHANISNIEVSGEVANAVRVNVVGTGSNTVTLVNVTGDFTEGAVEFAGVDTADVTVLAVNVVNVGEAVTFNNTLSGGWDVSCFNVNGFSGVTQLTSLDRRLSGLIAGSEYFSVTSSKRMGVGDAAPSPQRALHIAQNLPHIRISDMDAVNSTEVNAFVEWYRGLTTELVGLIGFPSPSTTDFVVRNEIAAGDVVLLAGGNNERLRAKATGGVDVDGNLTIDNNPTVRTIYNVNVAASVTGTLVETTLATIPIPALSANATLRINPVWSFTNSGNIKTLKINLNASTINTRSPTTSDASQATSIMRNRGATNSQATGTANTTEALVATAIQTNVATTMTLTGTLSNIGETITLEAVTVEIVVP